eukprot:445166_1
MSSNTEQHDKFIHLSESNIAATKLFQELTQFTRNATHKIFGSDAIADIIYTTISKYDYDDAEEFLDDLEGTNDSFILVEISKNIQNNDVKYEWNDEDNKTLYQTLLKIYRDNITDITQYDTELFVTKIINIAKQLNKTMRKPIDTVALRRLLTQETDLRKTYINHITQDLLIQKAKKYNIKPHHVGKIFHKLQSINVSIHDVSDEEEKQIPKSKTVSPSVSLYSALIPLSLEKSKSFDVKRNTTAPLSTLPILSISHVKSVPPDETLESKKVRINHRSRAQSSLTPRHQENTQKRKWKVGSQCECYSRAQNKWISGTIRKIFTHSNQEWLLVKLVNGTDIEIQRYDKSIRTTHIRKNSNKITAGLPLKGMFDQKIFDLLLEKLEIVLEEINKNIHKVYDVLYQVYYVKYDKSFNLAAEDCKNPQ